MYRSGWPEHRSAEQLFQLCRRNLALAPRKVGRFLPPQLPTEEVYRVDEEASNSTPFQRRIPHWLPVSRQVHAAVLRHALQEDDGSYE